ncbi:hypothetical protein PAEVO_03890 [Paenibacillus sp. GM2FR]|uniref:hypothetical protein n=1 Tax=Paenibacillus sp. GM2FR TaxID=2059268 RepID=UPI000C27E938|nr:hypothetical protein [Paenibacillus sp. GM2FR]PJN53668.1 hypothetical protein PAEVO_03890 [Paenibacillus sp. GM2FR]
MQEKRILKYIDTESKDYVRAYANTTLTTVSPYNEVVIDFCEETLMPYTLKERYLDSRNDLNVVFSHGEHEILVEREKKFSVTMNQSQALKLAKWIFENCREDGDR